VLTGDTEVEAARKSLLEKLKSQHIDFEDKTELTPSQNLEKKYGIIRVSVANLRSAPRHSAELATQSTLGTIVKIYKKQNAWYLIQTPDRYLAWVDGGAIQEADNEQVMDWQNAPKLLYTQATGFSFASPDANTQSVSDVVWGNVFKDLGTEKDFQKIGYPDGREAFLPKNQVQKLENWTKETQLTQQNLVLCAKKMMGLPYLWGGTSFKGVDCSGFTKTVYMMNGWIIPRDASQQIHEGEEIDSSKGFEKLEIGDLLFFGEKATENKPEKVIHVGMWIDNNEFIHSSNFVRIGSMDEKAGNFDAYERNRFLRAKRFLNKKTAGILPAYQAFEAQKN